VGKLLLEQANIVEGIVPIDLQDGANTGDYVSLKNYGSVAVVFVSGIGTAGDDPTLTIQQATAVAGTGAQALNFTDIYRKQAATSLASTGTWTKTTQTAANTYTNATAAEQDLIWVVHFDAADLDVDDDYDCIRATVADVGSNAQLGYLFYIPYNPVEELAPASMASAIED